MRRADDERRRLYLDDLLELRRPLDIAVESVRKLPWDSPHELTIVTRSQILNRLRAYLHGLMSAADLEVWASAIEVRDDIGREPGYETTLSEFLFETANPVLSGGISPAFAEYWIRKVSEATKHHTAPGAGSLD